LYDRTQTTTPAMTAHARNFTQKEHPLGLGCLNKRQVTCIHAVGEERRLVITRTDA